MEADIYPVWQNGRAIPTRAPKTKPTSKEQEEYNRRVARKKLIRLVNANFDNIDYLGTLTYRAATCPQDEDRVRMDVGNYIRRVKRARERELKARKKELAAIKDAMVDSPKSTVLKDVAKRLKKAVKHLRRPLRYAYTIHQKQYQRGCYQGRYRFHVHLFITGGLDSLVMEEMWGCSASDWTSYGVERGHGMARMDHYNPQMFGPQTAASYIIREAQGHKRFAYSQNLKKPKEPKPRDGKLTRRQVEKMAKERVDDRAYWERRYKGYRFLKCYARWNDYNKNWYVSVVMYKASADEDPPEWREEEWITTEKP